VLIAVVLALAELGPGPVSLDAARGRERAGVGWALAAAGAGVLGALGAQLATAAQAPPQPIAGASSNGAPPSGEPAPEAGEAAAV